MSHEVNHSIHCSEHLVSTCHHELLVLCKQKQVFFERNSPLQNDRFVESNCSVHRVCIQRCSCGCRKEIEVVVRLAHDHVLTAKESKTVLVVEDVTD